MQVRGATTSFSCVDEELGVAIEDLRVALRPAGGAPVAPDEVRVTVDGDAVAYTATFGPLVVELAVRAEDDAACIGGLLRNTGGAAVAVDAVAFSAGRVRVGAAPGRFRFFANGYQSWSQTRSFGPDEAERVPLPAFARLMQDDLRNLPSGRRGDLRSETFAILGELAARRYLLVGQGRPFDQALHLRARFDRPDAPPALEVRHELGDELVAPGAVVRLDDVHVLAGDHPNRLLERYLDTVRAVHDDRRPLPVGWCSWYYYFTKVREQDVDENLEEVRKRAVDWHYIQIDDGYQTQVGDWLSFHPRFPNGLRPLVERIEAAGMRAGLWLAPFSARADSRLFRDHPDWFLRDARGKPALAGWNPLWGVGGRFYALDTTHPAAAEWLRHVVRTMVHYWGFRYLKLDFVYSAAIYARAHDPHVSPAGRLKLGYRIVREAAGPDVFLLGCGAPLAPSIGLVDGMRIGPDVAPFWFPTLRYHLTRDPHALSAKFAIRSILTRAQLHRRLWENDPDCLMLRDTETKLTAAERETLADAIAVTGGMLLVSDRLSRLPEAFWGRLAAVREVAQACAAGRAWPLDLMEREMPELVYNSAGYLAIFNFSDRPAAKRVRHADHLAGLLPEDAVLRDVRSGRELRFADGELDLGVLPAHGSALLRLV